MPVKIDSAKLRAMRRKKKLSQMHLAELCESSDRYIRDLELGVKENPSAALLYLLSRVLETPMEALMIETNEEEEE